MRNRALLLLLAVLLMAAPAFAQTGGTGVQADQLGADTAQQALQEVSISEFEDPGFWRVAMPIDAGLVTHRRFEGAPAGREPLPEDEAAGIPAGQFVLGVRADFFRRQTTQISIIPARPLPVPGITKTISVWVVGRNFNHRLSVVIQDALGRISTLPMGTLNYTGWRQLTVAVPPTVRQQDANYANLGGIQILGFVIDPLLTETFGTYYVYFDDLRAVTDLFGEEARDADDLPDGW